MIRTATVENFEEQVSQGLVLVDFWAAWCGPCRTMTPLYEEIAQEVGQQLSIIRVNIEESGQLANRFGVMSVPTVLLFKQGQLAEKIIGYQSKTALLGLIKPHL